MIYQIFTTLLRWKPSRRFLQWAKKRKFCQGMVPMIREWYEKDFIFQYPAISFLGDRALENINGILSSLKFKKPLIVTDPILIKTGIVDQVIQQLKINGIKYSIFEGVKPNPTTEVINGIVERYKNEHCDALISVGGGSAHDASKGASLVLSNNKSIRKFQGLNVTKNVSKMLIIAINTTAGTGSGVTNIAVITDESSHFKMTLVDKNIQPHILVDDSNLMKGLPVKPSMWVGIDTLVHAIEAELSIYASIFTKVYARQAMRMVYRFLPEVYKNPNDINAREKMAYAEFLGGMAFNSASLGFIHSLSHALSGTFDTPHGLANAVLLPYVLDYELKYPRTIGKIAKISDFMSLNVLSEDETGKAKETIKGIIEFTKTLKIPSKLSEIQSNITDRQIKQMATKALKDYCGISNPVQFSRKEIIHIYRNAINGTFDNINE